MTAKVYLCELSINEFYIIFFGKTRVLKLGSTIGLTNKQKSGGK